MAQSREQRINDIKASATDQLKWLSTERVLEFLQDSLSSFEGNQHFLDAIAILQSDPKIGMNEVQELIDALE